MRVLFFYALTFFKLACPVSVEGGDGRPCWRTLCSMSVYSRAYSTGDPSLELSTFLCNLCWVLGSAQLLSL